MRPGCIFVSHRSILIWLICFFYASANIVCSGFPSLFFVIFWMLYFVNFPKSYVFHARARHFYMWLVSDELKFGAPELVRGFIAGWQSVIWKALILLSSAWWAVWVLSAAQRRWKYTLLSLRTSLIPAVLSALSSVFLFTPLSFDCYSQLAESTFSTCAIQRYFSTSMYSFWGFWCTFFYDLCYISLMVNGYISWVCKSIWWLCTVSL